MGTVTSGLARILTLALVAAISGGCSSKDATAPSGNTTDPTGASQASSTSSSTTNTGTTNAAATVTESNDLVFSSALQACDETCTATSFSIDTLRELHVYALWHGLSGDHVELRKYYSPDGSLYYQKLVAFSTDPSSADKAFEPTASIPHTRTVQLAKTTTGGASVVWDYLPVGGTWITQHHMVGTWRVELFLDKLAGTPDVVKRFTLAEQSQPSAP